MNTMPVYKPTTTKVIDLSAIIKNRKKENKPTNKRPCNKVAGVSSEVYALQDREEISAMVNVLNEHIDNAPDKNKRWVASRNKLIFLIGINISLRASDLCDIKWSFFLNKDGTFKDGYSLQPKKTKKTGKFVKVYFNETIKKTIKNYLEEYPIEDLNDYVFKSRQGNSHITSIHLGKIIKDTAKEAGIKQNVCSHSLRKTFGFWVYHQAKDKDGALIILQEIFKHSSPAITSRYIGLTDNEISEVFNELNLGDEFI